MSNIPTKCYSERVRNYIKNREIFAGTGLITIEGNEIPEVEYFTLEEL